ncbi:MAG: hypothetical protein R3E95_07570 [Thiolinea sp.]
MRSNWTSQGLSMTYVYVNFAIKILAACWTLFIGAKLLQYRDMGRRHFNAYFVFLVVSTLLTYAYQWAVLPRAWSGRAFWNSMLTDVAGGGDCAGVFLAALSVEYKADPSLSDLRPI